jgi:hypothetical protein
VSCDTGELQAEYAAENPSSTSSKTNGCGHQLTGDHANAIGELRAGAVKARRPRGTRGRSEAQRLDSAEHNSKLKRVMAGGAIRALCPQSHVPEQDQNAS